ncbi:molybdenum cofactor biosynthesis protein MoaE [Yunchengibacter salinarum]|uniref:molybdenum cofactor biosynthesis protein MoaE n=1 Tax=Yunchengibacter salinarum TaxID=3133399 RepID=UPI0035B6A750
MSADSITDPVHARVQQAPIDHAAERAALTGNRVDMGAVVSFTGTVRDQNGTLTALHLDHYPGMTEREIRRILDRAMARWPLTGCRVVHRVGTLAPGEDIVAVLTASAHREAAFDAARFIMDYLKTDAPFWKREDGPHGSTWVPARAGDDAARTAWEQPAPANPGDGD